MENKLGIFLKTLRVENELTQKELADRLHVSPSTISKWEMGVSKPDVDMYEEVAEVLKVSALELFYCKRLEEKSDEKYLENLSAITQELLLYEKNKWKRLHYQNLVTGILVVMLIISLICNVYCIAHCLRV